MLSTFVIASLAILATPGPTNTLLAASGAVFGLRRGAGLTLAEAAGYAVAIGFFITLTTVMPDNTLAMSALKALAAAWLLISAINLWRQPVQFSGAADVSGAAWRVFLTTILNPKAMFVGCFLIPDLMPENSAPAVAVFVTLSCLAGLAWLTIGERLPTRVRPYAYKVAAVALGAFSVAAAAGSMSG
ncbi:threonine/homoserine/homoserine lactone efflux protein [Mesorhizobium soli]|jgi:threonine/homoserine/homoserine lactone efflux protein|uniref:threonine transporter n=1 Tax=Pseudaminobacter soli (ex Li et al. 2025) TaxID=1295366 RepID=UPI002475F0DC|nr:threonine transporter [Mesorhizobium soli]MDH6233730.1 threonine/homoserine/homoserine lactone efflux protein [Mesorhizobium soli]